MPRVLLAAAALVAGPPVCVDDCVPGASCVSQICGLDPSVDMVQWSDGRTICDVARARTHTTRDGRVVTVPPRTWYWPHPGDLGCWRAGQPTTVRHRTCRGGDCSPWSDSIEIPALPEWRCYDARGEVPCG